MAHEQPNIFLDNTLNTMAWGIPEAVWSGLLKQEPLEFDSINEEISSSIKPGASRRGVDAAGDQAGKDGRYGKFTGIAAATLIGLLVGGPWGAGVGFIGSSLSSHAVSKAVSTSKRYNKKMDEYSGARVKLPRS